jgi:hypothetical protein
VSTYKLIQDIEAEDKILGPLTLRQFIFALIAIFLFYICFIVIAKHVIFLLALFLPPALFFGFFALPFGRDQPTEVWFLAKLRFWFKPRQRVWNQSGIKELVTITVPKKVERVLTNGLSQTEVKSRLGVLAQTLDSRGWAVKHVESGIYTPPGASGSSDRLLSFDNLPQEVPSGDTMNTVDMLDETMNPIARQFDNMITQSSKTRREALLSQLNSISQSQGPATLPTTPQITDSPWFMSQGSANGPAAPSMTGVGGGFAAVDDSALSAQLAARANSRQVSFGNLRTVRTTSDQIAGSAANGLPADVPGSASGQTIVAGPMTAPDDPAILSLARNDDLNVATLARQAKKNRSQDEVVISLH